MANKKTLVDNSGLVGELSSGDNILLQNAIAFPEVSAPATPSSGLVYVYAKSDGKIYKKDDTGSESELGGGGNATEWIRELSTSRNLTNTTSVQKIFNDPTNGACTLSTGTYFFELVISVSGLAGWDNAHNFVLLGAGTATIDKILYMTQTIGRAQGSIDTLWGGGIITNSAPSFIEGYSTYIEAYLRGHFRVTSAGTLIPSIQLTTATSIGRIEPGTFFSLTRVGEYTDKASSGWS